MLGYDVRVRLFTPFNGQEVRPVEPPMRSLMSTPGTGGFILARNNSESPLKTRGAFFTFFLFSLDLSLGKRPPLSWGLTERSRMGIVGLSNSPSVLARQGGGKHR